MSARTRRRYRRVPENPVRAAELWQSIVDLRTEWLNHALSTAPADRGATEDAISKLYALLGHTPPEFVWVGSPAAAMRLLPVAPQSLTFDGPQPLENRLATLVATMRERLDRRIGLNREWFRPPEDPVAALRSGVPLRLVLSTQVHDTLRGVVRGSVAGLIRGTLPERLGLLWWGQHDTPWIAHYDAHRRIAGVDFGSDAAQLELWATLARSCGWWWPREDVCVIAERPTSVHTEPDLRLHCPDGPAVTFRDGEKVHAWHGTRVPAWVIEDPTADRIATEPNIEVRRCAIERLGWGTYIERAGLTLVRRADDPGNPRCELRLYDLPWGPQARLLLAINGSLERDGTRRHYGLRVPPWFDDPIDAAAWSYGLTGPQYARLQRRT